MNSRHNLLIGHVCPVWYHNELVVIVVGAMSYCDADTPGSLKRFLLAKIIRIQIFELKKLFRC